MAKKTCINGHQFEKSSDCPICPQCEKENKSELSFLSVLSAPARRALVNNQITSLEDLANYSEFELLKLHGFGKASLPKLRSALAKLNLEFKSH